MIVCVEVANVGVISLVDDTPYLGYTEFASWVKDLIGSLFMTGAIGALFGAQLGFLEGLILAFP
jgi:hypothetical protein